MTISEKVADLLKQGLTPAEIRQQGYSSSVVSHVSGAYKRFSANPGAAASTNPEAVGNLPTKRLRRGRLKSSGSDSVDDRPGMLMVTGRDVQAEALLLQSKAIRLPMPELLPLAMSAARKEWGWPEDLSVVDFIDTVLYHFFAAKGVFLGTYYKLEDIQQLIVETKQLDGSGASLLEDERAEQPDEWVLQEDKHAEQPDDNRVLQQGETLMDEVEFDPQMVAQQQLKSDEERDSDVTTIKEILSDCSPA